MYLYFGIELHTSPDRISHWTPLHELPQQLKAEYAFAYTDFRTPLLVSTFHHFHLGNHLDWRLYLKRVHEVVGI